MVIKTVGSVISLVDVIMPDALVSLVDSTFVKVVVVIMLVGVDAIVLVAHSEVEVVLDNNGIEPVALLTVGASTLKVLCSELLVFVGALISKLVVIDLYFDLNSCDVEVIERPASNVTVFVVESVDLVVCSVSVKVVSGLFDSNPLAADG